MKVYAHRLVGQAFHDLTSDLEIDHRFHNTSDIKQIRPVTRAQNVQNARGWKESTSKYKGVSWSSRKQKWYACISIDKKTKNLGCFDSEDDAARAYDKVAYSAWGEFAFLNFGNETTKFQQAAE